MTTPRRRGDAPIEAPATEAARALLDAPDVLLMQSGDEIIGINEGELELQLAAIEAAARDEGRREAAQMLRDAHKEANENYEVGIGLHELRELADRMVAGLNASESPRHGRSSDPTEARFTQDDVDEAVRDALDEEAYGEDL